MEIKYRCANDIFGYCTGKSDIIEEAKIFYYTEATGKQVGYEGVARICQRDKKTCGFYRTFTEIVAHTITPPKIRKAKKPSSSSK